jgi:PadR family transcriptional regulator PadR
MPDIALTEFEQLVLLALMHQGRDAYGVSIAQEIGSRTGREVSIGAIYKILDRLEDRGLVGSRLGDPTPERGGRRKKHYRLLTSGERALRGSLTVLARMTAGLEGRLR